MIITLFTNGTLITPKIATFLEEYPPFEVEITLYGITKKPMKRLLVLKIPLKNV